MNKAHSRVGIGVAVRDWNVKLIATLISSQFLFREADTVESIAALQVVSFCIKLGLAIIILEGDDLVATLNN